MAESIRSVHHERGGGVADGGVARVAHLKHHKLSQAVSLVESQLILDFILHKYYNFISPDLTERT